MGRTISTQAKLLHVSFFSLPLNSLDQSMNLFFFSVLVIGSATIPLWLGTIGADSYNTGNARRV